MVEYDFDDQDDFCLADLDLPAVPELYCDPLYHKFVKKIYFNVVTWECKDCELNLHYDKKTDGYNDYKRFIGVGGRKWPGED